jgi:hypothetical protein
MISVLPTKKEVKVAGALKMVKTIPNFIICGAGYGQTEGQWDQGIPALCRYLHQQHASDSLRVEFFRWDEDWAAKADWIFGCAGGPTARILCINYSWSVGNGFVQFARQLQMRGQYIERAVFSDGVYHYGGNLMHRLGLAQLIACAPRPWGRPEIHIPRNVGQVDWFVQSPANFQWLDSNTWLRGHRIVWDDDGTDVEGPNREWGRHNVPDILHHWMDDSEEFQNFAINTAQVMFGD